MSVENKEFVQQYGPWALVTGAAQGLGKAFAEALAAKGFKLVMVDRQPDSLAAVCEQLSVDFATECLPVVLDLSNRAFISELAEKTASLEIGLVVNNAAIGNDGAFLQHELDDLFRATDVNCIATLAIAHTYGKRMVAQGRGGMILVASGTALQGTPRFVDYAATKSFSLVLAEGLWCELQAQGVDVMGFIPGPTNTPGLRSSVPGLKEGVAHGPIELPETCANGALEALGSGANAAREEKHDKPLASRRAVLVQLIEQIEKSQHYV